jgi:RNA polymerase sigma-70 factor (ECF subfamily)
MRAVCHKDRKALATLYLKYAPQVRSYIASNIESYTDTDDLVQEVFLQIWHGKGHYDSSKGVEQYIFGIARNMIRRFNREKERLPKTMTNYFMNGLSTRYHIRENNDQGVMISLHQFKRIVEIILTELSPKAREAVRLRFIDGLSIEEAATKAGCSIGSFYKRSERAEIALRKAVKKD